MDDIYTGVSQKNVNRMMGTLNISSKLTDTIPRLLDNMGLRLKSLVQSGSKDCEAKQKLSWCALGYLWNPSKDIIEIKFKFNPSKKCKGVNVKA